MHAEAIPCDSQVAGLSYDERMLLQFLQRCERPLSITGIVIQWTPTWKHEEVRAMLKALHKDHRLRSELGNRLSFPLNS